MKPVPARCLAALMLLAACDPALSLVVGLGDPGDAGATRDATRDATTPQDAGRSRDVTVARDTPAATDTTSVLVDLPPVTLDGPVPPALPPFDAATRAHIADVLARGRARGNHANVFAKIGDSITESGSFLFDCGSGFGDLGTYGGLQATIAYFSAATFTDPDPTLTTPVNSFNRHSLCAMGGWLSSQAITPYMGEATPRLVQELDAIHPAWALVEYGTNDDLIGNWTDPTAHPAQDFAHNIDLIVTMIEDRGVVAVLYTIPPLVSVPSAAEPPEVLRGVLTLNDVVRAEAATRHLPLIDFWAALHPLAPGYGVDPADGIHPSVLHGSDACVFTVEGLQYGYNVRNLITVEMLQALHALAP